MKTVKLRFKVLWFVLIPIFPILSLLDVIWENFNVNIYPKRAFRQFKRDVVALYTAPKGWKTKK